MKKLLMLVLIVLGAITLTSAQEAKPPKKIFVWNKVMMTEVGIPTEVQAKVEAFKKQNDDEQKALKESDDYKQASEQEKKKKMGALLGLRQKTIYNMLSKEHQVKVDEIREKFKKENEANGYNK